MHTDKKRLIVNDDGHGGFFTERYATPDGIRQAILAYRGTGLDVFEWGINMGTKVNFLSDTFERFGQGSRSDFANARRGDRRVADILADYAAKGIDPLNVVADACHDVGIQCYASIRMNPDYNATWMGDWLPNTYNETWYFEHGDLRIRERDGSQAVHISYAYPEMRQRKLRLAEELLAHPVDGLNLDFLRHPPFVGTDAPLVDEFRRRHGADPRQLPEDDARWLDVLGGPMTEYLRGARRLAGKRAVSARVDHKAYRQQGLDIQTWMDEGLIDTLIVSEHGSLGGFVFDLRPFVAMARGRVQVLFGEEAVMTGHDLTAEEDKALAAGKKIDVSRRKMTVKEYCRRALDWYAQGADGVHIFNDQHNVDVLRVLGDPDRCRAVAG